MTSDFAIFVHHLSKNETYHRFSRLRQIVDLNTYRHRCCFVFVERGHVIGMHTLCASQTTNQITGEDLRFVLIPLLHRDSKDPPAVAHSVT